MSETNVQEQSVAEPAKPWLSLEEQIELAATQLREAAVTLSMAKVMAEEELTKAQREYLEPYEPSPDGTAPLFKLREKVKRARLRKIRPLNQLRRKLIDAGSKVLSVAMLLPTKQRQAEIARRREKANLGNGKPPKEN